MPARQVIVDGSNLATEGRSLPSLSQLDQAVREFLAENPGDLVTVVVDASFGHRIDPSELRMFEEAEAAGEVVSPPAGAIGRGDAFLLRIAEKTGATVLSNDSFQEFHGDHPWLFDDGRLIGGKPVPGVGWIFMPRTPVRGQKSREVVKEAKRKKRSDDAVEIAPGESGLDLAASRSKGRAKKVDRAIARATEEAVEPKAKERRRRGGAGVPPAEPVNEPLAFIKFIAAHPLGSEVDGTVSEFSSHGAFVMADGARCYIPLSAMGDPPPRRAREVVGKGEERHFVVQALDPQRRGIELALPGFAHIAGGPTEETVEAEIHPEVEVPPKRRRRVKEESATRVDPSLIEAPQPALAPAGAASHGNGAGEGATPAVAATPVTNDAPAKRPRRPARAGVGPDSAGGQGVEERAAAATVVAPRRASSVKTPAAGAAVPGEAATELAPTKKAAAAGRAPAKKAAATRRSSAQKATTPPAQKATTPAAQKAETQNARHPAGGDPEGAGPEDAGPEGSCDAHQKGRRLCHESLARADDCCCRVEEGHVAAQEGDEGTRPRQRGQSWSQAGRLSQAGRRRARGPGRKWRARSDLRAGRPPRLDRITPRPAATACLPAKMDP